MKLKILNALQNFFVAVAGGLALYMALLIFGLPAMAALLKILNIIPQLVMPYNFFGYIFLFWLYAVLFGTCFKITMWFIESMQAEEVKHESV